MTIATGLARSGVYDNRRSGCGIAGIKRIGALDLAHTATRIGRQMLADMEHAFDGIRLADACGNLFQLEFPAWR